MIRRASKYGKGNYWWGCPNFPECRITSAEHPDGSLMSTPADQGLKELRKEAHRQLEKVFGSWYGKDAKKRMYDWLKVNSEKGHIGLMNEQEVKAVIAKLNAD